MHHVFLDCEDTGSIGDFEHTGQPAFWIDDGKITHHYLTRRNFDMEACQQWLGEWRAVMGQEAVVCFSGEFVQASDSDSHPSSPPGVQYYWIIDRMKSHAGEWSYFFRKNADE